MNMPPINKFKRFDVRDLLQRGGEPFPEIHKRVSALKPDEGLIIVAPFLPSPLVEKLAERGVFLQGRAWPRRGLDDLLLARDCLNEVMSAAFVEFKKMAVVNTLRSCQLFTGLPQPDLQNIAAVSVVKSLEKGEYLFHEGDPAHGFYVIQRGAVNVHRVTVAGKEQIIHVFRTGDSFAEVALASATGYPADARALEPRRFCSCKRTAFSHCSNASRNSRCGCLAR